MSQQTDTFSPLQAVSPLDGRYHEKTAQLEVYFSEAALMRMRVAVEMNYLVELSHTGVVRKLTNDEEKYLLDLSSSLSLQDIKHIKEIEEVTRHDVKAVEKFLREKLSNEKWQKVVEMIHFGITSDDVNNLAFSLLFAKACKEIFVPLFEEVITYLASVAQKHKATPMLARTHGQDAVPTTVGKELINFAVRLQKETTNLKKLQLTGKFTGAVGNFNALVVAYPQTDWISFSKDFVSRLGLEPNLFTTQINTPESIIEMLQIFTRINGILLDLDQDMWRYISDGWMMQEVKIGEIGSSTMPQKVNPIDFENSEGNIKVGNALIDGVIHGIATSRLQRDLSDSTIMRNIGVCLTYSFLAAKSTLIGLRRISPNTTAIFSRLGNNWAILAEALQTLLRKENTSDAYEKMKELSRGKVLSENEWKQMIKQLPVDESVKKLFENLTPENYLGYAEKLTELAIASISS